MRLSYFALMYSGDGNRKYKMTGTCELHEPRYAAMTADLSFDDVVLYPNPYITVTPKGYTKHYFMGAERFCTTIGGGNNGLWLVNPIDHLTQDEANLLDTLENSVFYTHYYYDLYEYHHCHNHTENTDYTGTVMPNDGVYELYQYTEGEQTLGTVTFTFYSKFEDKIHEYSSENNNDEPYYYHSDHLGSAAWITDKNGLPVQYIMHAPYGEELLNQHPFPYRERFTFTGKERDEETGYLHFDARKFSDVLGFWLSPDPLLDKYIYNSPYVYCEGKVIVLTDPNGWGNPLDVMKVRRMMINHTFGMVRRNYDKNGKLIPTAHQGIDYYAPVGTDIMAVKDGVIVGCDMEGKGKYGKTITLQFENEDGTIAWAFYAHLSEIGVSVNDEVKEGDVIGKTGITGNAKDMKGEDQHLHFEYRTGGASLGKGLDGREDPNLIVDTKFEIDPNNERKVRYKEVGL